MNCNHDVPVSAACIIRELEHRGWELTKAQTLNGDNWEDILFTLVPELRTMCGFQQNNPYHVYDVWKHTAEALKTAGDDTIVALTVLFHDIGKPQCYTEDEDGRGHFYGHGPVSAGITNLVMKRLKFDEQTKRMYLAYYYPYSSPEEIQENTGFEIDLSRAELMEGPSPEIIRIIREEIDPGQVFIKVPKEDK